MSDMSDVGVDKEILYKISLKAVKIKEEVLKHVIGFPKVVEGVLTTIFAGEHAIIEGVPGTAKTTLVRVIAKVTGLKFQRIQFTPDLLPSDITGSVIWNPKEMKFEPKWGPITKGNLILADEINRSPPKTKAALLEAMQERQVTIGDFQRKLLFPFSVIATMNPIETYGTYPLGEAELDRFMVKLYMNYPKEEYEEIKIVMENLSILDRPWDRARQIVDSDFMTLAVETVNRSLRISPELVAYCVRIVRATRKNETGYIKFGASPRAAIMLAKAASARALLVGKIIPDEEDVIKVARAVLRHRLVLSPKAKTEGMTVDSVIKTIIDMVEPPRQIEVDL